MPEGEWASVAHARRSTNPGHAIHSLCAILGADMVDYIVIAWIKAKEPPFANKSINYSMAAMAAMTAAKRSC
jgi:hypothetical protein